MSSLVRESVAILTPSQTSSSVLISVISFLALLYAASGLFYQLQFSLNTIWRVPLTQRVRKTPYIRQRIFTFVIVIGIGLVGEVATALIPVAILLAGLFFQFSSFSSALQAAGAFTMLLVSFYYVAQIFLLDAACCRISAGLRGVKRPVVE